MQSQEDAFREAQEMQALEAKIDANFDEIESHLFGMMRTDRRENPKNAQGGGTQTEVDKLRQRILGEKNKQEGEQKKREQQHHDAVGYYSMMAGFSREIALKAGERVRGPAELAELKKKHLAELEKERLARAQNTFGTRSEKANEEDEEDCLIPLDALTDDEEDEENGASGDLEEGNGEEEEEEEEEGEAAGGDSVFIPLGAGMSEKSSAEAELDDDEDLEEEEEEPSEDFDFLQEQFQMGAAVDPQLEQRTAGVDDGTEFIIDSTKKDPDDSSDSDNEGAPNVRKKSMVSSTAKSSSSRSTAISGDFLTAGSFPVLSTEECDDLDITDNLAGEEHLPFLVEAPADAQGFLDIFYDEKGGRRPLLHIAKLLRRAAAGLEPSEPEPLLEKASTEPQTVSEKFLLGLFEFFRADVCDLHYFDSFVGLQPLWLDFLRVFGRAAQKVALRFKNLLTKSSKNTEQFLYLSKMGVHLFPISDLQHPVLSHILETLLNRVPGTEAAGEGHLESLHLALLLEISNLCSPDSDKFGKYVPGLFAGKFVKKLQQLTAVSASSSSSTALSNNGQQQLFPNWVRPAAPALFKGTVSKKHLVPLKLHKRKPAQIPMLDPVFHDPRDGILAKGDPNRSAARREKREQSSMRRAAARELRRDAEALISMQAKKEDKRAERGALARKRSRAIMDGEAQTIHELKTANATSMDTSLHSFKRRKKEKKLNRRLAGNKTNADVGRNLGNQ